jgi:undecaprenyl-diphosphatase
MLVAVPTQLGYSALGALILGESAGLPLPGETALIVAGGLAAAGHMSLPLVVLVAAAAAIAGDTAGYLLGRRGGRAFLLRDGLGAAHRRHAVARADVFFARYGVAAVFFGRWVPVVRVVVALCAGATRMPWRRFGPANAAGALAWAATVATLAWLLGPAGSAVLAVAGLAVGGVALVAGWLRRRLSRGPGRSSAGTSASPARAGAPSAPGPGRACGRCS